MKYRLNNLISCLKKRKQKNRKTEYFICYTAIFMLMSCVVFGWWISKDRTLIWQNDGWDQHFRALVYYSDYLKEIIKNLLYKHQLIIPSWDFAIGEGSDILQSLHYYVIGDPFTVFSVFIPTSYMYMYYNAMIILRLYCSGLAFSLLCFDTGHKSRFAVMAGSINYVFCYWALLNAARHPYFLNPMVFFPLMILGIEKILKNKRPYLFIISVFLSSMSNFYFFYVMVLLCVIYVAVRLLCLYGKNWKHILISIGRIAISAIMGVLMGAIVFIPIANAFLNDSRLGLGNAFRFVYSLSYYSRLPGTFLSHGQVYWTCMGYVAPVFLAVCLLFMERKKNIMLKIFMGISGIIMVIPFLGQIFNGFSYMSNRWIWVLALLVSYILTTTWPKLMELEWKEAKNLLVCTLIYMLSCLLLDYSRTGAVMAAICFLLLFLFLIFPLSHEGKRLEIQKKQQLALLLIFICVFNTSYWMNAPSAGNYAAESLEESHITENLLTNETEIVKKIAEKDGIENFYRYSGRGITVNAGTLAQLSSTQYYWSLANPYISDFRTKMEMAEEIVYNYRGYDDRTSLISLSGVRYFVVPTTDYLPIPYGFSYVGTYDIKEEKREEILEELKKELGVEQLTNEQIQVVTNTKTQVYRVYKNNNALPLAYTYDQYTNQQDWESMNSVQKQETMQKSIVLDGYIGELEEADIQLDSKVIEPEIICNSTGVTREGNTYVVTQANASITLKFEGVEKSETYIGINGITFAGEPVYDLYFGDEDVDPLNLYNKTNWNVLSASTQTSIKKNKLFWTEPTSTTLTLNSSLGVTKQIFYRTEDYSYYNGRHDFTVNMNYSESKEQWATITFSNIGTYTIDSIKVICQPMENYVTDIEHLKEDTMNNMNIGTDTVSGTIELESPKMLCFAIPYSSGWTAYVDGEEVPLYRANDRYMAVEMKAGAHNVLLKYQTPLLKVGFMASLIGFGIFVSYILWNEQKQRKIK